MIGKRAGSRYEAGKRTGTWIKLKLHLEQEFMIGGYTDPEGGRKYFGSLLVGFYEGKNPKFAGRVGTGFSDQLLRSLYSILEKIRIEQCPFFNVPVAEIAEKRGVPLLTCLARSSTSTFLSSYEYQRMLV